MKIILLVCFFSFCIYHTGAVKTWLRLCTINEHTPLPPEKITTPLPPELTEREQLEINARYVIAKQGQNPDTVKYMSDGLLQALVWDYIKEVKKQ